MKDIPFSRHVFYFYFKELTFFFLEAKQIMQNCCCSSNLRDVTRYMNGWWLNWSFYHIMPSFSCHFTRMSSKVLTFYFLHLQGKDNIVKTSICSLKAIPLQAGGCGWVPWSLHLWRRAVILSEGHMKKDEVEEIA